MSGYIKVTRDLIEKPIMQNPKLLQVWMWCLLKTTYKNYEQMVGLKKISLSPGQFITGRHSGAAELKMNPSTFWKNLQWLQSNESLDIKSNNKFTVITVVNWEVYQCEQATDDSKNDRKITAKEQQNNTNKKVKKVKNNNKPPISPLAVNSKVQFAEFVSLTNDEYLSLVAEVGEHGAKRCLEILDNYKGASGKQYKSDFRAIRNWVITRYLDERGGRRGAYKQSDQYAGQMAGASRESTVTVPARVRNAGDG